LDFNILSAAQGHLGSRKMKHSMIFLERMRKGHHHWNCFKGNVGETSERWGGVHMGFSECLDTTEWSKKGKG